MVIFSTDLVRGRILQEVLMRSRVESLVLKTIQQVRETISRKVPEVAVLDTVGCFREEIKYLKSLCGTLAETAVILLGDGVVMERFEGFAMPGGLHLSDPLDPELIVEKVEALLLLKVKEKDSEDAALEESLKGFLRLS